jgi:translocator protein
MNTWYQELTRPHLTPPNWVFGPAWTILYIMIAISIIVYYQASGKQHVLLTTLILAVHLLANFSWTPLFFGAQNPLLALLDIIVLDVTLVVLIFLFWKASTLAAVLLIPYLCWVSFATYLNAGFYWLNRGFVTVHLHKAGIWLPRV